MPNEKELFQTTGTPWSELAGRGELDAVLTGSGDNRRNLFLHNVQLVAAEKALSYLTPSAHIADFGCGTGRFLRFFSPHVRSVLGTEITPEMLEAAKGFGIPTNCKVQVTDGIHIPADSESLDLIWVCGVLRYSLNVPNPAYTRIVSEMLRVLKPGGRIVNLEMYIDQPSTDFSSPFEKAGFSTDIAEIIHRHFARPEQFIQRRLPLFLIPPFARILANTRFHLESPTSGKAGLRDYLFVWRRSSSVKK